MKHFKKVMMAFLILTMLCVLMISVSSAQERVKKIVLFHENVSWEEIDQYAQEWHAFGAVTIMRLPIIHGLVLLVPANITSVDMANDPRVVSVEDSQRLRLEGAVNGQSVSATADGGAADGGAADGGAADGGAADGGAWTVTALCPPAWSPIQPAPPPSDGYRPWSILKLFGQFPDPWSITGEFDPYDVPDVISLALDMLGGETIRIAIFDTGIDSSHPNLAGAIKGGIDLVYMTPYNLPWDDNGHGTHIAGTLCARLYDADFGLVPGVELYVVKILDQYATGDLFNIIMGLQWAVENDIDIVNMSIGYRDRSSAVRLAILRAYQAGLILVAAAGNHSNWDDPAPGATADGGAADGGAADGGAADGGAADGGAADGGAADGGAAGGHQGQLLRYSVMYPARYREVIAVGASTTFGLLASFSNSGPHLDLIAPGTDVISTNVCVDFGISSGTSMAVPHVTGAIAMMLALNPYLDAAEVRRILIQTAYDYNDGEDEDDDEWITCLRDSGYLKHRTNNRNRAGEVNLIGALEKVLAISENEERYVAFQRQMRKALHKIYREELKKKLRAAGNIQR